MSKMTDDNAPRNSLGLSNSITKWFRWITYAGGVLFLIAVLIPAVMVGNRTSVFSEQIKAERKAFFELIEKNECILTDDVPWYGGPATWYCRSDQTTHVSRFGADDRIAELLGTEEPPPRFFEMRGGDFVTFLRDIFRVI